VSIAPAIVEHYPELSKSQRAVVRHLDGPLLVIAGSPEAAICGGGCAGSRVSSRHRRIAA